MTARGEELRISSVTVCLADVLGSGIRRRRPKLVVKCDEIPLPVAGVHKRIMALVLAILNMS